MARWDYSFSNLGPKKQISGVTYYKVSIGSDVRWLSMEGINMLHKAKQAGVTKATVMKATSYYTGRGTQLRIKKMRGRIAGELASLMQISPADFRRLRKGMLNMTKLAANEQLFVKMEKMLSLMTEQELRQFFKQNAMLLEKFFTDSDKLRGVPAEADEGGEAAIQKNIEENANLILAKMEEIVSRRLGTVKA